MTKFIYDVMELIYGTDITQEVAKFLSTIMTGLATLFQENNVRAMTDILIGASVALLICYFYMDLSSKASMEMLTTEKLVLMFIKLFVGIVVLLYLPTIIMYLFKLANAVYETVRDADIKISFGPTERPKGFYFGKDTWPKYEDIQSDLESVYKNGVKALASNIGMIVVGGITWAVLWLARVGANLAAISNALTLVVYIIFSPIAVVNCFDGGTKSEGSRYLRKIAAKSLSFAVIIVTLKASEVIGNALLLGALSDAGITKLECTEESIAAATSPGLLAVLSTVRIAAVGAIFAAERTAAAVVGSSDGH